MENSDRKNWLYGIIAFLLLVLVIETGFLISRAALKSTVEKERRLAAERFPKRAPLAAPAPPRAPAYSLSSGRTQWDPLFEELRRMQEEMNQLLGESYGRMMRTPTFQAPVASFFNPDQFPAFSPAIDLQETEAAYVAKADLPGIDKEKIAVSVSGNVLTLQGERKEETTKEDAQKGFYATERTYGSFSRSISLPGPVDESAITADYKNGVLTVTLPKLKGTSTGPKQVPIT
jgi:HSP20 family protein